MRRRGHGSRTIGTLREVPQRDDLRHGSAASESPSDATDDVRLSGVQSDQKLYAVDGDGGGLRGNPRSCRNDLKLPPRLAILSFQGRAEAHCLRRPVLRGCLSEHAAGLLEFHCRVSRPITDSIPMQNRSSSRKRNAPSTRVDGAVSGNP